MLFATTGQFDRTIFPASVRDSQKLGPFSTLTTPGVQAGWSSCVLQSRTTSALVAGDQRSQPILFGEIYTIDDWIAVIRDAFVSFSALVVTEGSIFAVTDRLGVEPLFYSIYNNQLSFSSRAGLLQKASGAPRELRTFEGRQLPPPGQSVYEGVARTPLGSFIEFRRTGETWEALSARRYVPLIEHSTALELGEAIERIQRDLFSTIRGCLTSSSRAFVPLSGGVDSSTIAAVLRSQVNTLDTVTVGTWAGNEFAEARETADILRSDHREYMITEEQLDAAVRDVILDHETWDLYTVSVASPATHLYRVLGSEAPALVSGYGADILFAGLLYPDLTDEQINEKLIQEMESLFATYELRLDSARRHGAHVRRPYLADAMIDLALAIPGAHKRIDGIEKFVMRKAVSAFVPASAAWRAKLAVNAGAGMSNALNRIYSTNNDADLQAAVTTLGRKLLLAG